MTQVRIRPGCQHRQEHKDYDSRKPTGNPGPLALAGDVIEVTQAEMDAHGDKFTLLDPVSAVLSKSNGATPASVPEPASVDETAIQMYATDLEKVNIALQNKLADALACAKKAEQSAKRARATLKSERKKNQAVETLDKPVNDATQTKDA